MSDRRQGRSHRSRQARHDGGHGHSSHSYDAGNEDNHTSPFYSITDATASHGVEYSSSQGQGSEVYTSTAGTDGSALYEEEEQPAVAGVDVDGLTQLAFPEEPAFPPPESTQETLDDQSTYNQAAVPHPNIWFRAPNGTLREAQTCYDTSGTLRIPLISDRLAYELRSENQMGHSSESRVQTAWGEVKLTTRNVQLDWSLEVDPISTTGQFLVWKTSRHGKWYDQYDVICPGVST